MIADDCLKIMSFLLKLGTDDILSIFSNMFKLGLLQKQYDEALSG